MVGTTIAVDEVVTDRVATTGEMEPDKFFDAKLVETDTKLVDGREALTDKTLDTGFFNNKPNFLQQYWNKKHFE